MKSLDPSEKSRGRNFGIRCEISRRPGLIDRFRTHLRWFEGIGSLADPMKDIARVSGFAVSGEDGNRGGCGFHFLFPKKKLPYPTNPSS
jgi:hypothetical protein